MNLVINKCDQILKYAVALALLVLAIPAFGDSTDCKPFLIYRNMKTPPAVRIPYTKKMTAEKLIAKISALPEHSHFATVYGRFKPNFSSSSMELNYLKCIYGYLKTDYDRDGILDWKISSNEQLFSHLLPLDDDWDNDGVANLLDENPVQKSNYPLTQIPQHLRLTSVKRSKLNSLQDALLEKCRVLALNHTDNHDEVVLENFLSVCKPALAAFKTRTHHFILYAFSSHATSGDIVASFYAESNFMSVGGKLMDRSNTQQMKLTIAHEIGHFLTFNYLTPKELAEAARKYGNWNTADSEPTSFFDPRFLEPAKHTTGFFPSMYSYTNIHEWFGEVFANALFKRLKSPDEKVATHLPPEFDTWMSEKFQF